MVTHSEFNKIQLFSIRFGLHDHKAAYVSEFKIIDVSLREKEIFNQMPNNDLLVGHRTELL